MSKFLNLIDGRLIPTFGFGTWQLSDQDAYTAVKLVFIYAIEEAGYIHIDCGVAYLNEEAVGKANNDVLAKGIIKREELFVTTKCWHTCHTRERVLNCCKQSLQKLKIEYIDYYLIHSPIGFKECDELIPKDADGNIIYSDVDYLETWQGMEDCFNAGLVKSIGLSNFNAEQIQRVLNACKVKPVLLQIESHPYLNQPDLHKFCKSKGIVVVAFGALGSPVRPWGTDNEPSLFSDSTVNDIASRHKKTAAQVLIRYQVQREIAVVVKSANPSRIKSNYDIFDFELNSDEMKMIDCLDRNYRYFLFPQHQHHKYYPF
ncbi:aldo-keto reductase-like protein [Leptotrombidium deliense]|uniref:Aldo-keto reductase-like protein n=1 Tax=Leptotrombidium deliense TaxID=299467 RepID=A0A443SB82_9ACAR|nr:aldo-keto reductase-like protein [Leptotrombidium deliense]